MQIFYSHYQALCRMFDAINCVVIFFDIILCLECSNDNDCLGGKICQEGRCSKFNLQHSAKKIYPLLIYVHQLSNLDFGVMTCFRIYLC